MSDLQRVIRPDDFDLIVQLPGIAAVARDAELRLIWCTKSHLLDSEQSLADYLGTTLDDTLPPIAAQERNVIHRRVIETGEVSSFYQFSADSRVLCTIFPLDEAAFGHRGTLALVREMHSHLRIGMGDSKIPVMSVPNLHQLDSLSLRELEVLHLVATGISTQRIADLLCRACKTVEHHINSIHSKIGTHSRGELVRYTTERGIQSFTVEEWGLIVDGARRVRKEVVPVHFAIETKGEGHTESDLS